MSKRKTSDPRHLTRHPTRPGNFQKTREFQRFKGDDAAEEPSRPTANPKNRTADLWLYGVHAVRAALDNPRRRHKRLLVTPAGAETLGKTEGYLFVEPADRRAIDAVLPPGAVHQGVALLSDPLPEVALDEILATLPEQAVLVALDQVTDPQNIGAVLRSAAAFGALAVILPEHGAPDTTGALAKAASGALELVPLVRVVNLAQSLDQCKAIGCWTVGLAGEADALLSDVDLKGRSVLVLGAEGPGLRRLTREKCDFLVKLPTSGPIAHLNVSNAAAVSLYEWARRPSKPKK